ncbi:MAG: enoyl-CoA hydratase [Candidatus Binatia bacterium]
MTDVLTRDLNDGVLVLTLNRPDRLNALNPPLMRALVEAAHDAADDARVGVVVLRGSGRAFCAGGDIGGGDKAKAPGEEGAAAAEREAKRGPDTFEMRARWLRGNVEVVRLLRDVPKPTIAMVQGAAAGAGLCIAAACDLRVAAENATFTTAFAKVGFSGDYGGTYFLTRLLGTAKARELYFLGDRIDATEALRIGLVNKVVPLDALELETMALARRLARGPRVAYLYMKRALNAAEDGRLEDILDLESFYQTRTGATDDHREAARAFFEKREPVFKGS